MSGIFFGPSLRVVANSGDGAIELATVEARSDDGPQKLYLQYGEALNPASIPASGDFALSDGRTVTGVSITDSTVVLEFTPPYELTDAPTVTYTEGTNPIERLRAVESDAFSGQPISVLSDSIASLLQSLPTQNSQSPIATDFTMSGTENVFRLFVTPSDFRTNEPWTDLWIRINSESVKQLRLYYWQARYVVAPVGASIGVGTVDGATIRYHKATLNLDAVPALPGNTTTSTANCDKNCPPYWTPASAHISFPGTSGVQERVFSVPSSATHSPFFVSEFDGTQWTPPRFYKRDPNKETIVQCVYGQISLCTIDGSALDITAISGATIGGTSEVISIALPTATATYNISTVAELETRLINAVSGDRIVLADGTYSLTQSIEKRAAGIQLISQSNDRTACVISGNTIIFRGVLPEPVVTTPNYLRGIGFDATGQAFGLSIEQATWNIDNCNFANSATDDCFIYSQPNTGNKLLVVNSNAQDSNADCWNFYGEDTNPITDRDVHLVCCTGSLAGNANNAQIVTTHTGLPISIFGCRFSDAQFNVSANDGTAGATTYAFFSEFTRGAREAGVVNTMMLGCYCDHGTGQGDNQENSFLSYRIASPTGAGGTGIARNFTGKIVASYLECNTGTGRILFNNSVGDGEISGSILDNAGEGILLDFISGGPFATPLESSNNTFVNNSEAIQQNTGLPLNLVNSAALNNNASINTTTGGFAGITGSSNTLDANVDSDYTGLIGDILAVDAALDSALRPIASGNCDENGTVPSTQILGLSDPFGLVLVQDVSTIPRGARARLVNTGDLYPDAV